MTLDHPIGTILLYDGEPAVTREDVGWRFVSGRYLGMNEVDRLFTDPRYTVARVSRGKVYKVERYTRFEIRARPAWLYVFGDNMRRVGMGGQAKEARNEPNAVGIPTKWSPDRGVLAYFMDSDFDAVKPTLDYDFEKLEAHLAAGGNVVWPADGIGTGLAELPTRAPKIYAYIEERLKRLETGE